MAAWAGQAFSQAGFESQSPACTYAFPTPCSATGDPEGVSWNGVVPLPAATYPSFGATVGSANGAGMPCGGSQFLRVQCANSAFSIIPPGGPIPEGGTFSRVWIPIPAGANTISLCWDYYNAEAVNAAYNDAVSLDLVVGCVGPVLANLAYADTFTAGFVATIDGTPCSVVPNSAAIGVLELTAPGGNVGPQFIVSAPLVAGARFLRITAANSLDDAVPGQCVVDGVSFTFGTLPCALVFSSPFGPGSIQMANTACPAAATLSFFAPVDLTGGAFPTGWFHGVDMTLPELVNLFIVGPPFTGTLDGTGASSTPGFGPTPLLSGLTLHAVTTHWAPGFGAFVSSRTPTAYTIP
jgi:hypothetical protein